MAKLTKPPRLDGEAHVHCVIIGLSHRVNQPEWKRLFSYENIKGEPEETLAKFLSPYLFDASGLKDRHNVIHEARKPAKGIPAILYGSKPVDQGHLILSATERDELLSNYPDAFDLVRPLIGAKQFLNGGMRYCLWLHDVSPSKFRKITPIMERVKAVKKFREDSKKKSTREAAQRASEFAELRQPLSDFLIIPMHTSERRKYVPLGYFSADNIVHNSCTCVPNVKQYHFSVLSSQMHMDWMRYTCGRIKSDFRYSNTLVYNTFPWPNLDEKAEEALAKTGQAILDARAEWPDATLADLYDPDAMPANLRKAHIANDKAVDRLYRKKPYRKKPFESERERVEHLFMLYEQLQSPILAATKPKPRKSRAKTVKTS